VPQVEVSFDIDANGILSVSAKDLASGKKQGITITASSKLSKEEVDRMLKQAEQYADEDKLRAERVEKRNRAESLTYEAERVVDQAKGKLTDAEKDDIRAKVKALRDAVAKNDTAEIDADSDALTRALHAIAPKLYEPEAGAPPEGGAPAPPEEPAETPDDSSSSGTSPDGPVDADFKVVDDHSEPGKGPS
jgi:molecular chaperone DnaK